MPICTMGAKAAVSTHVTAACILYASPVSEDRALLEALCICAPALHVFNCPHQKSTLGRLAKQHLGKAA